MFLSSISLQSPGLLRRHVWEQQSFSCFLMSINSLLAASIKTVTFTMSVAEPSHSRGGRISATGELMVKDGFGLNH